VFDKQSWRFPLSYGAAEHRCALDRLIDDIERMGGARACQQDLARRALARRAMSSRAIPFIDVPEGRPCVRR
jgi:hypothetical protein